MSSDNVAAPANPSRTLSASVSSVAAGFDLFLISLLLLFLELACIRWFPAHVLFLTFFTNVVLLACFLGMSVGCLAADSRRNFLKGTPFLLVLALLAGLGVEEVRWLLEKSVDVGGQGAPQLVFFGTETLNRDVARFVIPIDVLCGGFFLLLALAMIGPGQELGRALNRVPNRVLGYTWNILGSVAGIALFAACSWWQLPPVWWFLPIALGLGYFLARASRPRPLALAVLLVALAALPWLAAQTSGSRGRDGEQIDHFWSPYYRIDHESSQSLITTNLIGHQKMESCDRLLPAYALPHLLYRDSLRQAGDREPEPFRNVLIIGAGSGNDVARALQWGAWHVDAVEIDPVIQGIGARRHPDEPYADPRVAVHLDDGRNFLRNSPDRHYDLVIYALVDSLVLHSSYSNIRLESYLFTDQAFADVRRCLKPEGTFAMYNFFRQGWIVDRLRQGVEKSFGTEPVILPLPYRPKVGPDTQAGGFTMVLAGSDEALRPVRDAFKKYPRYWLNAAEAPGPQSPDGFVQPPEDERTRWSSLPSEKQFELLRETNSPDWSARWAKESMQERAQHQPWRQFGVTEVERHALRRATDDWPFLYLREPMIPTLSLRGMGVMAVAALFLILLFRPPSRIGRLPFDWRMFFLGAGFMLIETKAVVHMALLFGSTWMVNSVVFLAVLLMILAANLFVLAFRPQRLWPYYVGLLVALGLNAVIPLDSFLGMSRAGQIAASCLLVFAPILFAGVVFAVSFRRTDDPGRAFGANIAGAMLGGLAENASMLLGFQYLILVAVGLYVLSALSGRSVHPLAEKG